MSEIIYVDVPVLSHVKAYIEANQFLKPTRLWKHTDPLWPVFFDYLEGKRTCYNYVRRKGVNYIQVQLSCDKNTNYRNIIPEEKAEKFNQLVERLMFYEFCKRAVLLKTHTQKTTKEIIVEFMQEFQFEECKMTFDRLKKVLYRYEIKWKIIYI